jgi:hypothetical protein
MVSQGDEDGVPQHVAEKLVPGAESSHNRQWLERRINSLRASLSVIRSSGGVFQQLLGDERRTSQDELSREA